MPYSRMLVKDLVGKYWKNVGEFATDIDVPYQRAYGWVRRNSIPSQYWQRLTDAVTERGSWLSSDELLRISRDWGPVNAETEPE